MRITDISLQAKNKDRVNISVDGKYRFSLDIFQVSELGIKIGKEYTDEELAQIETESQFGKLYGRALEYTLMRPHSAKEIRDYLRRKTLPARSYRRPTGGFSSQQGVTLDRGENSENKEGKMIERPGASQEIADRVYARLEEKGYVDDEKFTRWWVENRNQRKGSSLRKLSSELQAKGVDRQVVDAVMSESSRSDEDEIAKVIAKRAGRYDDEQKLIAYLARQGFAYDDIKRALNPRADQ